MSPVAIVTDSITSLPAGKGQELPIHVIPMHVIWHGRDYLDGVDISPQEFFEQLAHTPEDDMPRTAVSSPEEYKRVYLPLLEQGFQILSIHLSRRLSAVFDVATKVAEELGRSRFELVDSFSGSLAAGWQVLEAAKAAAAGASLQECKAVAENVRQKVHILFVPGTLEFLRRSGRVNLAEAFIGGLLQIRPIIETCDGLLEATDKARTMKRAMQRLLDRMEAQVGSHARLHLGALYADIPSLATDLLEQARLRFGPERIADAFTGTISPVIGTHIGPGSVGMAYMVED